MEGANQLGMQWQPLNAWQFSSHGVMIGIQHALLSHQQWHSSHILTLYVWTDPVACAIGSCTGQNMSARYLWITIS